jgi:hypothetical protein
MHEVHRNMKSKDPFNSIRAVFGLEGRSQHKQLSIHVLFAVHY